MKCTYFFFGFLSIGILTGTGCRGSHKASRETVKEVDLHKYMGTWYEIARFDHSFESGLTGVTATYSLLSDGKIKVINKGYKNQLTGKLKTAQGKARVPDPAYPGALEVSFFLCFYSPYYILELDKENYSYALIGSKSSNYLWILSRTPQLEKNTMDALLTKAKELGYDTSRLTWVEQKE